MKEQKKFVISSVVIIGFLLFLIGIIGIVFGTLAAGLAFVTKIIPLEIGIIILIITGVAINILSSKISTSGDKNRLSFLREIFIIKNLSDNLLKNGYKVVYVKLTNNMKVIGFTIGKVDTKTKKIFVFIPTTPVASTGITVLVDKDDIECSELTSREALLTIITGGFGSKTKDSSPYKKSEEEQI